jgi:predicted phage tail protein
MKGTYTISVTLDNFHPYLASNIEIEQEGLSHDVELEEIIVAPFSLKIEETGNIGERRFTWNNLKKSDRGKSNLGFVVYLNDVEKAGNILETEFLFSNLANGNYTAGVKSVYTSGASEIATIDFQVTENSVEINTFKHITLQPNPFTNEILISNPEWVKNVRISDILGQQLKNFIFNGKSITAENLGSGLYFVELEGVNGERMTFKVVKKQM